MPIAFEFYAIAGRDKQVRQFLKEYFTDYRRAARSPSSGAFRAGGTRRHRRDGHRDHPDGPVRGAGPASWTLN